MDEDERIELGMAVDEDEGLLADKQQGTSSDDGGDRPTESLSLNFQESRHHGRACLSAVAPLAGSGQARVTLLGLIIVLCVPR